jgi:2-C-methyl-D-erythritol 4-phosphate cytidylyltransferase
MNITLIFAGGSGVRMNSISKPKQFLQLFGKEIIIHTVEKFEKHPEIDLIVVVCIDSWINFLQDLFLKYNIKKVRWIIPGGKNGQESIYNGLSIIAANYPEDSVILIHDGVRPIIENELISRCIRSTIEHGSAITATPAVETIISILDRKIDNIYDRAKSYHAKAPQCFRLADIWHCHQQAISDGVCEMVDSASLMKYYGYDLFTVQGSTDNIKITTPSDFYIFRALFEVRENSQIFGL